MSQKVARNVTALVGSRLIAGLMVLIGYAAIFRYLGTFRTGQYQFALAYVLLFQVIVDFGIQQLVIKKVSENKSEAEKYLGNFFAVEFVLAMLIYALLVLIARLNGYDLIVQQTIWIVGAGMFINALTIPHTAIISAFEDMHILATVNFFDSVINVSIMFLMILLHSSILFLALVQATFGTMHLIVYSRLIKRYVPDANLFKYLGRLDWPLVKNMFQAALPFGALVGFSIVYNKIDVIILSHIRGYSETGIYTAAYKYFDFMAFFPGVVSSSLYPFFSAQLGLGNVDLVRSTLQKYTKILITIAMPLALGGFVLSQKLNLLIAGKDFFAGYKALNFLVFASATLIVYSAVNSLMISQLTKFAVIVTFSNIFINAIGNILLIPHFGFAAAGFMTLVSELNQAIFYFYFVRKKVLDFSVSGYFMIPVLSSIVMAAAIYKIRAMSLLVTIPLGAVIYAAIIFAVGFIRPAEFKTFKNLILRRNEAQSEQ